MKVLSEGRKRLGFDQAWMPDSDFKRLGAMPAGFRRGPTCGFLSLDFRQWYRKTRFNLMDEVQSMC